MSKIYLTTGLTINSDETYDGKFFFRKSLAYDETGYNEFQIAKILLENPSNNIVHIYKISERFIDMELLETQILIDRSVRLKIRKIKEFLQNLGIMYIDWKMDNFGIDGDGNLKIFDFDCSGIIDTKTNAWILRPPLYFNYKNAVDNGMKTPKEIDDYCFDRFLNTIF
jgi:hypothetical protein